MPYLNRPYAFTRNQQTTVPELARIIGNTRVRFLLFVCLTISTYLSKAQCVIPTSLYFDKVSSRGAYLYCSRLSGATYQARWRATGTTTWTESPVSEVPRMIARGLVNNTTYEWQVRSICNNVATAYSANGPNFTTQCKAPSSAGQLGEDDDSAYLWWEPLLDEQFNIYYRAVGTTAWSSVTGITGSSYTLSNLNPLTTYEWFARTLCSDGNESGDGARPTFSTLSPCDMFEPNNSAQQATRVRGPYFLSERLCIKPLTDQDWFFWRYAGHAYYIQVGAHKDKPTGQYKFYLSVDGPTLTVATQAFDDGASDLDTYIRLYAADATTLLAQNDNSGGRLVSRINFTLPVLPPCSDQVLVNNGMWLDDDIWSCGRRPTVNDMVRVPKQATLQASEIGWTKRVQFEAGGKLILQSNAVLYIGR